MENAKVCLNRSRWAIYSGKDILALEVRLGAERD